MHAGHRPVCKNNQASDSCRKNLNLRGGANNIINMKFSHSCKGTAGEAYSVLETQAGLLHKIRAIIMDSRMSEFKGKFTFDRDRRAVQ